MCTNMTMRALELFVTNDGRSSHEQNAMKTKDNKTVFFDVIRFSSLRRSTFELGLKFYRMTTMDG